MECTATLRSGVLCGKPARYPCYGKMYCGRHKKEDTILAEYDDLPLANLDFRLLKNDPLADSNLQRLNGYINIKIGWPVFVHGESCPLVLISNEEHFTRITLAEKIVDSIKYFLSNPEVYELCGFQLEDLKLDRITYDVNYGIFITNISTI